MCGNTWHAVDLRSTLLPMLASTQHQAPHQAPSRAKKAAHRRVTASASAAFSRSCSRRDAPSTAQAPATSHASSVGMHRSSMPGCVRQGWGGCPSMAFHADRVPTSTTSSVTPAAAAASITAGTARLQSGHHRSPVWASRPDVNNRCGLCSPSSRAVANGNVATVAHAGGLGAKQPVDK